jgi:glucose dehydrogenase
LRHLAGEIAPIGLGAAIGGVWLMSLGGSLQFLMAASALTAASQLLLFLNLVAPPRAKRAALAYRMIAPSQRSSDRLNYPRKGGDD